MFQRLRNWWNRANTLNWDSLDSCQCHELNWQPNVTFLNHIDGAHWETHCQVCCESAWLGYTKQEAQAKLDAWLARRQ